MHLKRVWDPGSTTGSLLKLNLLHIIPVTGTGFLPHLCPADEFRGLDRPRRPDMAPAVRFRLGTPISRISISHRTRGASGMKTITLAIVLACALMAGAQTQPAPAGGSQQGN